MRYACEKSCIRAWTPPFKNPGSAPEYIRYRGGSKNLERGAYPPPPHANAEDAEKMKRVFFCAEGAQKMKISAKQAFSWSWSWSNKSAEIIGGGGACALSKSAYAIHYTDTRLGFVMYLIN